MADLKPLKISALILAAGRSSRFRGRLKALSEFGGRSLLQRAADNFQLCGVTRVAVVTGHERAQIEQAAKDFNLPSVFNPDYEKGMFSSVLAGLPWVGGAEAFFVQPVDGALVHPQTILSLMTAWSRAGRGRRNLIFMPTHEGRAGHPLLVGGNLLKDIARWSGGEGLRGWLASLMPDRAAREFLSDQISASTAGPVVFLKLPDAGLTCDIDTPEDLAAAREPVGLDRPSAAEAWTLLRQSGLKPAKMRHSVLVAAGALRLGAALAESGRPAPDLELLTVAGLLHDLARREHHHALAGRARAAALGWAEPALIIGAHTDPPTEVLRLANIQPRAAGLKEPEIQPAYADLSPPLVAACLAVYLADKYFLGARPVSIRTRFMVVKKFFRREKAALATVNYRETVALAVEAWFRKITGRRPGEVVLEPLGHQGEQMLNQLVPFVLTRTLK